MDWYSQYRGRSCGRILHCLNTYCGLRCAEMATVGDGYVDYHGQRLADYVWLGDSDIPQMRFYGENAEHYEWEQLKKQLFLDNRDTRFYLDYLVQELGMLYSRNTNPSETLFDYVLRKSTDQALRISTMSEAHLAHLKKCARMWADSYKIRCEEIETYGFSNTRNLH